MAPFLSTDAIKTPDGDVLTDVLGGVVADWTVVGVGDAPAFGAGWGDAATDVLAAYGPARFYSHGGRGYVQGAITGTPPDIAFVLPVGCRPDYNITDQHALALSDDLTASGVAQITINPGGDVLIYAAAEDNIVLSFDFRLA